MTVDSKTEMIEALTRSEHERILGTSESEWLDFKIEPYQLDTAKGRRDLIADAASFANHLGGVILVGVRTKRSESSAAEVADELRPVSADLVDTERILALVRAHVTPLLHLDVRRYPCGDDEKEIVAIVIDPQKERDKPFIVDRLASSDDDKDVAHAFGWPTRHGADTHWVTADRIQPLLANALRRSSTPREQSISSRDQEAEQQLKSVDDLTGWQDWGWIAVQAIPEAETEIPDFYGAFSLEVQRWSGTRQSGFGLGLEYGALENLPGHLVASDARRHVAISRAGVVTAAAVASPDFLAWANHQNDPHPREVILNPYVVVEFPSEAVRFAEEAVGPSVGATGWTFRVVGEHLLDRSPVRLRPQPREFLTGSATQPLANSFRQTVTGTGDVWRDAFAVIAEIYGTGFGLGSELIPFAEDGAIDLAKLA